MTSFRAALCIDTHAFAGTERHILDLAHGLGRAGVEACIICPPSSPLAERAGKSGVEVIPGPQERIFDAQAVRRLRKMVQSERIQILHAHNGRTSMLAALATRGSAFGRSVMTQHFLEPAHAAHRGPKAVLFRAVHQWVNRNTHHFIAISEAARHNMLARKDAPAERITVVPNGIPDIERSSLSLPDQLRAELSVPINAPLVLCVARLEREKDIATLINAMKLVNAELPGYVCLIAGEGSQKQELSRIIQSLGLDKSVRLLGFRTDALALINACDVLCLPSAVEAFGLTLVEAMALNKPVISTNIGGPAEIVLDGCTGRLVPPADSYSLGRAIIELVQDQDTRIAMGRSGRKRYLEQFTAERMARETLAVYHKILAS